MEHSRSDGGYRQVIRIPHYLKFDPIWALKSWFGSAYPVILVSLLIMDAWNQNVSNVLARYEVSIQARHACRIEEDREADEALASMLQGMHEKLAADIEKLDNEQIELKDRVMTLHDEILANLDAIDDKLKRGEELKKKTESLKDIYIRDSEEAKQELDRKRVCEDMDHRAALQTELIEMIEARPRKKRRCDGSHDSTPSVPPTASTGASCQAQ
ncbi:Hypothetical protein NCS54_01370400 [Fusarium falciforme]|uniref:Hypothetical protein n=1 Tax=Fusarium falciforme TaxID=195108 RepID=UPI00230027C3|nr:Hypothetical protein NCS54_01370400 [Fusarium falciforme]WAO96045.1 Hypothetical protein NCS54_01370400 [Fusarium falciforme]